MMEESKLAQNSLGNASVSLLKEGAIVKGPYWDEPVEIIKVEDLGGRFEIRGRKIRSKISVDASLTEEELSRLTVVEPERDFLGNPEEAFLALEAHRFKLASSFDELLAMSVSKIDPLPFQIDAVYNYVLKQPRIRFLIADDPGAGKTIMAGLVLKELKLRNLAKRILIVVPGHLKDQWRRELKEKFGEIFFLLDRSTFNARYGENPWETNDQIITSMDFAKQDEILASLSGVLWDLAIVDEAHKMAAYRYNNKTTKTKRYKLGETLSNNSTHLLFLTATPHKGDPDNFRLFLDLLVPGFFATDEMIEEALKNRDNPIFIRRLKEDLRDFNGRPIFTRRFPKTVKFRLSDEEKELYNEVSRYVFEQYNKALQSEKKRNIAFALMILQRRMASSTYALLKSLERRRNRLQRILNGEETPEVSLSQVEMDEFEDLEESERWKKEEEWETLTVARNRNELIEEINILENLIEKAQRIIEMEKEKKLVKLKESLKEGFSKAREMGGNPKVLIFTESKDTLQYLVSKIKSWGYSVNFIHGGMPIDDRIRAEKVFRDETDVLVATEAAGEGINLQFCHVMINYDIPWNPNRLEQRMGRIHRYGQQKDVYIFNLVAEDTREGKVLARLLDKLNEIKDKLGSDRVFDVIGEIFEGKNLLQLLVEAITAAKSMDEILQEIEIRPDEEYIAKVKEALNESLATRHIDLTRIKELSERAREHRLVPEYVEEFFKRAFEKAGGKFRRLKNGFIEISSIPYELRQIAKSADFKNRYGIVQKRYPKVTFDKNTAFKNPDGEFVSFGHPLFEALLEWTVDKYSDSLEKGAVFKDPSGKMDGLIWFYVGEVKDGKGEVVKKDLLAVYQSGNRLKEINPAVLWDLSPHHDHIDPENTSADFENSAKRVKSFVIDKLELRKREALVRRKKLAEIKEKYGLRSLNHLIGKCDAELMEYYERQRKGEKMRLSISQKEEQKKRYEEARKKLAKEIQQEQALTISIPELLAVVRVVPEKGEMAEDEEIEKIGMEIAMEYERQHGRVPEDVSDQNLGFDIRSRGANEIRYIEVKARAAEGSVALTPNEWLNAKKFGKDYWLYVVENAGSEPVLYAINDPASNLTPEEKVEVVRYLVPFENLRSAVEEVWKA